VSEPKIPGGYILLSRKLIESEIFDKPPLYMKVWTYLLCSAQYRDYKGLKRGQLFTSIPDIQEACSWYVGYRKETPSKSKIYRIIDWLRKCGERSHEREANERMIETTNATHGMVISIVNYDYYQDPSNYEHNGGGNDEDETTTTRPKQERNNINKEGKECSKNNKKEYPPPDKLPRSGAHIDYPEAFEEFWNAYPRRANKKGAYNLWRGRVDEADESTLLTAAKNYAKFCEQDGREKKYIKHAKTFLSPRNGSWEEYVEWEPEPEEELQDLSQLRRES